MLAADVLCTQELKVLYIYPSKYTNRYRLLQPKIWQNSDSVNIFSA